MAVAKGQLVLIGYHTRPGKEEMVEPAVYSVGWIAMADGEKATDEFTVDSGYDFHVLAVCHSVEGVTKGAHVPIMTQVKPQNDREWFIKPVYINTISSLQDAGEPHKLPVKRVLPSQKIVTATFYEAAAL